MAEIEYPGIAKLVSRLVWDQETVRSSRTTRTKIPLKSLISEGFFLFFVYCGAGFEYDNIFIIHTSFFLLTAVLISRVISTVFRLC